MKVTNLIIFWLTSQKVAPVTNRNNWKRNSYEGVKKKGGGVLFTTCPNRSNYKYAENRSRYYHHIKGAVLKILGMKIEINPPQSKISQRHSKNYSG